MITSATEPMTARRSCRPNSFVNGTKARKWKGREGREGWGRGRRWTFNSRHSLFALASFRAQKSASQLVASHRSGTRLTGCAGDRPENVFQGFVVLSAVRPVSHPDIPVQEELFALVDAYEGVMLPLFQFWCLTRDLSYKMDDLSDLSRYSRFLQKYFQPLRHRLFPLVRGEIFKTRVSFEARSAELSRYKFVCRWRCREGLVQSNVARRAELSRYKFVFRWRCREGLVQSNVARRAELSRYKFVCRWRCREGLVKSNVARRAKLSRYKFGGDVLWSTDVIGEAALFARFLCERRTKVAGNFVTFIKIRQNDERKRRKVFDEKMSGKGVQADLLTTLCNAFSVVCTEFIYSLR